MKWLCSSSHAPFIKSSMPLSVHHDEGLYKVVMKVKFCSYSSFGLTNDFNKSTGFKATNDRLLLTMN